jgi:tRNA(Ile)-lysidine synthase
MRRPNRDPLQSLLGAVDASLRSHVPTGVPLAIGFSGGRDSAVLLDALATLAPVRGHTLAAIHIHHGLSVNADAWAQHCFDHCRALGVPCVVRRVAVHHESGASLEAEARRARYATLAATAADLGATTVALAHHRDDQAETLLLQLLRGAGPHGLAAMPEARKGASGVVWWRPLLGVARADIDACAQIRALNWIDDESNADHRHARNAMRHAVLPALRAIAPRAHDTLARAATHQAEAAHLLDELARLDAQGGCDGLTLERNALNVLAPHRARNLLRWFLRGHGLPAPSTARLAAMFDQLRDGRTDSRIRLPHAGIEIGVHQGRVMVHAACPPPFDLPWRGEAQLALPHGTLLFQRTRGTGIDAGRLRCAAVRVRSREGGERFQLAGDRPRRALKSILRDAGIPAWDRYGLPLVFCGESLAAVAGVGIDAAFQADGTDDGISVEWRPTRADPARLG